MVKCCICNKKLGRITETHLWHKHKIHFPEFIRKFPNANIGPSPWRKSETKETNPGLMKLSQGLKARKTWNFTKWQIGRRKQLRLQYKRIPRNKDLAELIGIVLGDGNLNKHPRTENLRITCNSKDTGYAKHIQSVIKKVLRKSPSIRKRRKENAVSIDLYQCKISQRLNLPCGDKIRNNVGIPRWILKKKKYAINCLKGLFETDGCFHEDKNNYTRVIEFKNYCRKLREDVYDSLRGLGFNPQLGQNYVRLAKKGEVYRFKEVLDFRNYTAL
ncbi:MAG: LAGLIDADG family homing endonuclease [Candidatus Omnitrophota bacterium]|jgi:hypothetical protein